MICRRPRACSQLIGALLCFALLPAPAAAANHSSEIGPPAPGTYAVACSDVAHDPDKLNRLGGTLDDYWSGNNGHYVSDIMLEPAATRKISPRIPDEGLYPARRSTVVDFVTIVCYPTDASNSRPDYVLPDGQVVPRMQRTGQSLVLPEQSCVTTSPRPAGCGRWPLLVFAHGLGSSPLDSYSIDFLLKFASQGYIVAATFHGDGRFLRLRLENLDDLVYLLKNFDAFVELQALRPLAVKSLIDAMLADPDLGAKIDPARIGGIGVSLGGETMTLLLGAQLTDDYWRETSVRTVTDSRIKAAVGYIPYAGQKYLSAFGKNNATTANVTAPYLAISGIDDGIAPMYRMQQALNNFASARYQVGLAGIGHEYNSSYADDIFGWAIPFLTSYLDCTEIGRASRDRLLQQLNVRAGIDDQLLIAFDATKLCFEQGWNLLGNGTELPIDVTTAFADSSRFQTVWKWLSAENTWAFYAPSLALQGGTAAADYAAVRGYRLLGSIAGGEGYWLYSKEAGSINLAAGAGRSAAALAGLPSGWHLSATGASITPTALNALLGEPPAAGGSTQQGFKSLWAWNSAQAKWYFYAPGLEVQGGKALSDYVAAKGYLDFSSSNKTLGSGMGFWIHKP